jgi:hypothetical protein
VTFSRGVGCATFDPPRPDRPVICGCCCCCAGGAEVGGVGACRVAAEAPAPPDGRADCCGACRGAAICGAGRGAAACGAGAARGAGAACGAGAGRAAGAACGAEAAGPPRPGGAPPPCFCGCATAVVAIAVEMMKHAAIRVVFHWNIAPPPASPATQRASWRAGFVCARHTRATHSMTVCSESSPRLQETDRRSRCGCAHVVHAWTHAKEERSCAWGQRDRWRCDAS